MTIKEVEKELGIPRATVRFYEKNGLINPSRNENSYRNYSDEDVTELRKIIILRKLGISVGKIADLQKGDAELSVTFSENLERYNRFISSGFNVILRDDERSIEQTFTLVEKAFCLR